MAVPNYPICTLCAPPERGLQNLNTAKRTFLLGRQIVIISCYPLFPFIGPNSTRPIRQFFCPVALLNPPGLHNSCMENYFRFQHKKKAFSFSEGVQGFSSEDILASEKNEWTVGGDMLNRENTFGAKHRKSYFEYDTWGGVDDRNFKKSVENITPLHRLLHYNNSYCNANL